jgi:hypothetical protein
MKFTIWRYGHILLIMLWCSATLNAAELDIPHTFQDSTPALATEVNANFTAVKTAVDENTAAVNALTLNASVTYAAVGFSPGKADLTVSGGLTISLDTEYEKDPDGFTRSLQGGTKVFYSAVTLPSGVVLTGLAAHVLLNRADDIDTVEVRLLKKSLGIAGAQTLALVSTETDRQEDDEKIIETILAENETIADDPEIVYFIEVELGSTQVGFYSVTLRYEYPQP